jgi:exopolyphosphatase/guanosine-5'-triphosphate,3'-diphosphate pyrophosphatase
VNDNATVAAVDCGTNSTRLLVVTKAREVVAREMRITRLGAGVDAARRLQPDSIARTLGVLEEYRTIMDNAAVGRARLVATSAVRDAANRDDFLEPASKVVGVAAELLSGDEEGRLSYAGATSDLPGTRGTTVVVDVGGGSTEIAVAVKGDVQSVSMDLGCVRVTERFLREDPPRAEEVAAAVTAIGLELKRAGREIPLLETVGPADRLVGLAGTVSTLAALEVGLTAYERDRIHHSILSLEAVERWCALLGAERIAERARRQAISPGREDVILGGALVLRECMTQFGFRDCIVSEADILDGLVGSLMSSSTV